ncbi:MAG TPA: hypothetical protein VHZ51_07790 [Ktedonobacteraceae bacterium]|nr:hypothetical protein [Ktedonobacteraceae bacterium]
MIDGLRLSECLWSRTEDADVRVVATAPGKRRSSRQMRLMVVSLDQSSGTSGLRCTSG